MMDRFVKYIKSLPKIYWIFFAVIFIAEVAQFCMRPDAPGLYSMNMQYIPFFLSLPFLFAKRIRSNFKRFIYTYSGLSFAFLAFDYLSMEHAGLAQITTTFCPVGLYWIVLFAIWNYKEFKQKESRTALALSAIAWTAIAFAFPPLPLGPASLLLLVPWFIVLNKWKRDSIVFATFWSGIIYNTINYYWIYNVMNVETAPSGLICFGVFLLIAYFSAYNVLAAVAYSFARDFKIKGRSLLLILYPMFYAGLEMTRTRGDFSFPWSHLGYVFGNHLELLQMLSIIGIFGYTILIIASNQIVAQAITKYGFKKKWPFAVPAAIFALLLIHGSCVLSAPEAAPFYNDGAAENPKISMVQPSIAQGNKWNKERFDSTITKTFNMALDSSAKDVNLIVLAETAVPDHIRRQPKIIRRLHQMALQTNASILTGALDYKRVSNDIKNPRRFEIYNAAFLFNPDSNSLFPERYIKKHLVPFSERIPFDEVFPILNYVDLGEGDFVPGKETPVYGPYKWTPFICYDAIFGDLVREAIREGSRLMVNITNDGWFGRSTAPYQHLNLVRYRAIENAYPAARLANSGVSAFIDQYGHYDMNTEIFTDRVIQRKVPLKTRDTLYSKIGDSVETFLLWFFLVYLLLALFGKKILAIATKGASAASGQP